MLECLAVVQLWFNPQEANGLVPGNFKTYANGNDSVRRMVDFFGLWVAGNKFIMTMLLLVCATSHEPKTRLCASATMIVGCAVYFWKQSAVLEQLELKDELMQGSGGDPATIRILIRSVFIPMWTIATVVEARGMLFNTSPSKDKKAV